MAYSTPAMVRQALIPTSDGSLPSPASHTAADLSDPQLADAVNEADATINGYIGGIYAVPVAEVSGAVPMPLGPWSRTIAAYLATCTYRGSLDFTDNDPVARRYDDVLAALKDVAAGRLRLQVPDNTSGMSESAVGTVVNPYEGTLWGPEDFNLEPMSPYGSPGPDWQRVNGGHW